MGQKFGIWDYNGIKAPEAVGPADSYELAIRWLDVQQGGLLEDWGCGSTYAKQFVKRGTYRGIDGAWTPFGTEVADLRQYVSRADAILLRHVLEHNGMWRQVLQNALNSFRTRMVIVIGTPTVDGDSEIVGMDQGIPTIHFGIRDLMGVLYPREVIAAKLTKTGETLLFVEQKTGLQTINSDDDFPSEAVR